MPKFDAATAVDPFEWDFNPRVDAHGTVPEPTDTQVARFYADLSNHLRDALGADRIEGVDLTDPFEVGTLFQSLTAEDNEQLYGRLLEIYAAVCSDSPNRDQLAALPFQVRRKFYGMVQEWLRPEAETPATND